MLLVLQPPNPANRLYMLYTRVMKHLPLEVTMSEFRDNLSAYLDAVEQGKTVRITRRGKPSAILSSVEEAVEAIDLADLQAFRNSLDVRVGSSAIVSLRQDERY
ncbi:hypothetical protein BH24DEI2_BH24DEI2_23880 [soil metagenome]